MSGPRLRVTQLTNLYCKACKKGDPDAKAVIVDQSPVESAGYLETISRFMRFRRKSSKDFGRDHWPSNREWNRCPPDALVFWRRVGGKKIKITGTIGLYKGKPEIKLMSKDQLTLQ